MKIILGSASPRRKSILENIFGEVSVISPSVDEKQFENENAVDYTERITNLKMDAVLAGLELQQNSCVITSDTVVAIDGKILGKPSSEEDAFSMLRTLSGREHSVLSGLCVVLKEQNGTRRSYGFEKTSVKFKILDDQTIKKYLNMIEYRDKAGSYAVQEHGDMVVDSVTGSMTNVIGFPLRLFFKMVSGNDETVFQSVRQ